MSEDLPMAAELIGVLPPFIICHGNCSYLNIALSELKWNNICILYHKAENIDEIKHANLANCRQIVSFLLIFNIYLPLLGHFPKFSPPDSLNN